MLLQRWLVPVSCRLRRESKKSCASKGEQPGCDRTGLSRPVTALSQHCHHHGLLPHGTATVTATLSMAAQLEALHLMQREQSNGSRAARPFELAALCQSTERAADARGMLSAPALAASHALIAMANMQRCSEQAVGTDSAQKKKKNKSASRHRLCEKHAVENGGKMVRKTLCRHCAEEKEGGGGSICKHGNVKYECRLCSGTTKSGGRLRLLAMRTRKRAQRLCFAHIDARCAVFGATHDCAALCDAAPVAPARCVPL